ncbi:histidyl-tRNA ligase [Listeria aquatica FSL S10-1188]|uniref:histidine--tRNA ligase n=1 Tax=Listeria aquatica FSL S10-1188 TaxID=1265818 RepID=W7AWM1_9LIST|nr:histidyl-tRNA ligase [Listeria aquatica FSL S10-1188]
MKSAPSILDFLNEESEEYFSKVKEFLDTIGISYTVDPTLVRGLDYYNHTTFEIMSDEEGFGAKTTLCGGGRYHGLVQEFDGPDTPGIGFGMGVERVLLALQKAQVEIPESNPLICYVISAQEEADEKVVQLVSTLRNHDISAEKDYQKRKLKAQLKDADRKKARYTVIIGEDEIRTGEYSLKNMATGEQFLVTETELITTLEEQAEGDK